MIRQEQKARDHLVMLSPIRAGKTGGGVGTRSWQRVSAQPMPPLAQPQAPSVAAATSAAARVAA